MILQNYTLMTTPGQWRYQRILRTLLIWHSTPHAFRPASSPPFLFSLPNHRSVTNLRTSTSALSSRRTAQIPHRSKLVSRNSSKADQTGRDVSTRLYVARDSLKGVLNVARSTAVPKNAIILNMFLSGIAALSPRVNIAEVMF